MWHKIISIIFALMFMNTVVSAQKNRVTVYDIETGGTLPNAVISLKDEKYFLTDQNGQFLFDKKFIGKYATVQFLGFKSKTVLLNSSLREIFLEPDHHTLEGSFIRGQYSDENLSVPVIYLKKDFLNQMQGNSLASMLNKMPGVRILSTGGIEKPVVEGMSGSRIAIIDNDSKLAGQHWGEDHAPEISIPSYATVTVLKGAEGVKYGSNAIGGIIHVSSELCPDYPDFRASFNSSYSSNGRKFGGDGFIETSPFKNFKIRLSGKYYKSGDYNTAAYILNNTGSVVGNFNTDAAWKFKKFRYDLHLSHYRSSFGIYAGSHIGNIEDLLNRFNEGRPQADMIFPFSYKTDVPRQTVSHLTVNNKLTYFKGDNRFEISYIWQKDYRREFDFRKGDNVGKPSFAFRLNSHNFKAGWSGEFLKKRLKTEIGSSLTFNENISDRNTNTTPIIPNYISRESGIYSILQYKLSDKFSVETGIRADHKFIESSGFNFFGEEYGGKRNFVSISGLAGFNYDFSNNFRWQSHAGLAWRAPEVNELYSYGIHHGEARFVEGDANLNTEKALKLTSAVHYEKERFSFNVSGFISVIYDYIYQVPRMIKDDSGKTVPEMTKWISGFFPKFQYKQSQALFIGGDLTLQYDITEKIAAKITGEWMWDRDMINKSFFPNIPSDRYGCVLFIHDHISSKWHYSLSLSGTYVTKQRRFDSAIDLLPDSPDGYFLLSSCASTDYHFKKGELQIYVNGENLSNSLYKDYNNRMRYFCHDKGRDITVGFRISW